MDEMRPLLRTGLKCIRLHSQYQVGAWNLLLNFGTLMFELSGKKARYHTERILSFNDCVSEVEST